MIHAMKTTERSRPRFGRLPKAVFFSLGVCFLIYVALCLALWHEQDSLIFLRPSEQPELVENLPGVQRFAFKTHDGTVLRGWVRRAVKWTPHAPLVVYFGGNGEDVSAFVALNNLPRHHMLVAVNYRGFGASDGFPTASAMIADALEVFDKAASLQGVDRDRIIVIGRSLGTGIATWVSKSRSVVATVLVSPYDSFQSVASEHYPMVPIKWMMRQEFAAAQWALQAHSRLITIVGTEDEVVTNERSKGLFQAWAAPNKDWIEIPSTGHTLYPSALFWDRLRSAIDGIGATANVELRRAPAASAGKATEPERKTAPAHRP